MSFSTGNANAEKYVKCKMRKCKIRPPKHIKSQLLPLLNAETDAILFSIQQVSNDCNNL